MRYRLRISNTDIQCYATRNGSVIATGTWTKMPGPRQIYWSHGLVVPEIYRRMGVSTRIHDTMWGALPIGGVVMLSVAADNKPQIRRMSKLGFSEISIHDGYSIYQKVKRQ